MTSAILRQSLKVGAAAAILLGSFALGVVTPPAMSGAKAAMRVASSTARRPAGAYATAHSGANRRFASKPLRVASVALVSDTVLLHILDTERLAAVSWVVDWADYSPHVGRVPSSIPRLAGDAEGVIALDPDLAIVADHSTPALGSVLRTAGIPTLELATPGSLAAVINDVERIGERVGAVAQATQWSNDLQARVRTVESHAAHRRRWRALIVDSGFAQGLGTLADDLLQHVHAENLARGTGLQGGVALDAERLLAWQPEVVFMAVTGASLVRDARAEWMQIPGYELLRGAHGREPLRVVGIRRRELGAVSPLAVDALEAIDGVLEELGA